MANDDYDFLFKIVMIGDSGVGKSNILTRFTKSEFNRDSKSTIGVDFGMKMVQVKSAVIKAQVWDTAGQDRYRSITSAYYRGAVGAILVFDVSKRETFLNLDRWLKELKMNSDKEIVVLMVGNKRDLSHIRAVRTEDAEKFAADHGIEYQETSALEGFNIEETFESILSSIHSKVSAQAVNRADLNLNPIGDRTAIDLDEKASADDTTKNGCC